MKISFCMPVFNKEIYLADSIESILRQTYKDWELIIVDDCSTDGTRDVAEWYAKTNKKIKVIYTKKNMGVATCRNIAWSGATGDIICVQDADDLSLDNRAKITEEYFRLHKDVGVMYGSCLLTDTFNRRLGERKAQDFSVFRLKSENYIAHPSVAYRRNLPVQYRDGLRYIDDWYFYLDCIVKGIKIEGIIQSLGVYRVTIDGLTLKGGYLPKSKQKLRDKLTKEFAYLEEDLSDKLEKSPLQKARLKIVFRQIPNNSMVLDMGCNGGYIMERLRKKGCSVRGREISKYLVDICQKKKLAVDKEDIGELICEKYDRIIFGDILEHLQPKKVKKILLNALTALTRKGKIIITVPYKHGAYGTKLVKEHVKDYELKDFQDMMDNKMTAKYITHGGSAIPLWMLVVIEK